MPTTPTRARCACHSLPLRSSRLPPASRRWRAPFASWREADEGGAAPPVSSAASAPPKDEGGGLAPPAARPPWWWGRAKGKGDEETRFRRHRATRATSLHRPSDRACSRSGLGRAVVRAPVGRHTRSGRRTPADGHAQPAAQYLKPGAPACLSGTHSHPTRSDKDHTRRRKTLVRHG